MTMKLAPTLDLDDALEGMRAAAHEANANGWLVSIAIVDAGGHLICLHRLNAPAATARISAAKANTAALVRRESKHYEDMINGGRAAFLSAPGLAGTLEGGVPIRVAGHIVGAIGVSGVLPNQDVQVAQAGVAAIESRAP